MKTLHAETQADMRTVARSSALLALSAALTVGVLVALSTVVGTWA